MVASELENPLRQDPSSRRPDRYAARPPRRRCARSRRSAAGDCVRGRALVRYRRSRTARQGSRRLRAVWMTKAVVATCAVFAESRAASRRAQSPSYPGKSPFGRSGVKAALGVRKPSDSRWRRCGARSTCSSCTSSNVLRLHLTEDQGWRLPAGWSGQRSELVCHAARRCRRPPRSLARQCGPSPAVYLLGAYPSARCAAIASTTTRPPIASPRRIGGVIHRPA